MRLTVLGSGSAFGGVANNAAYCIDGRMLIDCGAPVHTLAGPAGIDIDALRTVLLTHFHFDHSGQIVLFLGARALGAGTPSPLTLGGPAGTMEYAMRLLESGYGPRLRGLIGERLAPETLVLQDGSDVMVDGLRIRARAVVHSTGPSLAYAITGAGGETVGFSGDSTDCAGLRAVIAMSDLMVCECSGWDEPVPSHLWAGEIRELVAAYPDTTFLLSHLAERRSMPGALVAHDRLTLEVAPRDRVPPAPPPLLRASPTG